MLNYLITEAVFVKATHEEAEARKEAEDKAKREQWKEEQKQQLAAFR